MPKKMSTRIQKISKPGQESAGTGQERQTPAVPLAFLEELDRRAWEALLAWLEENAPAEVLDLTVSLSWSAYAQAGVREGGLSPAVDQDLPRLLVEQVSHLCAVEAAL